MPYTLSDKLILASSIHTPEAKRVCTERGITNVRDFRKLATGVTAASINEYINDARTGSRQLYPV